MSPSRPSSLRMPPLVIGFWVVMFLVFLLVFLPCIECPVCGPGSRSPAAIGEAMECTPCGNEQRITVLRWLSHLPIAPAR